MIMHVPPSTLLHGTLLVIEPNDLGGIHNMYVCMYALPVVIGKD